MSAVPSRGLRTGRSLAVLTYLEHQKQARSVREIINAVGAGCDCTLMYGTLSTLHRQGRLLVKKVAGNNMFRIAPGALINRKTGVRLDTPSVSVKAAERARAEARRQAKAKTAAVKAKPAKAIKPPQAPKPTRLAKAQHTAALATPRTNTQRLTAANAHGGAYLAAKRIESQQIAIDMDAFKARGGKVQKLGMHETSRPLNGDYSREFTINSGKRGTFPVNTIDVFADSDA